MHINLIAVGHKMPDWVNKGYLEYAERLKKEVILSLTEIPLQKRSDKQQISSARSKEDKQILKAIEGADYVITLDIPGKLHNSETLAERLNYWQSNYRKIALIIGGPEGISDSVKNKADESWSLGKLTFPHPLVRIIVAEAIYRAWTINQNHPYHRA
ncbi:23S rRNA (pseudouridine(1915)-N(3))-methyltransferase RlmH [Suttonella ornithocola]|uniref:Ribosomal RNA large subunit methyltransferase H n=1 Tax=Suttonella ornithocola TaxID=279832 RepID=A0A380MRS9_9GAMM|nr:23S rRNA (pseudouridine(1915)-N(3))-methyltransferase RlmH [Suttonella ornithocola]SUO94746.1 Ribosomal RNA large subunit methyltransferase H [Suttonella ornithocola]